MYAFCDCRAGVSGDMFLAAFCHLGFELKPLQEKLANIGIECDLKSWQECRGAGPGFRVDVDWPAEQPLRHPKDLSDIFDKIDISDTVRQKAMAVLNALTLAEAHAHDIAPEEVHFHEVGAIDTLVDILGTAYAMEDLNIEYLICSPLPWFSGTIQCAHGILPLPAPATAYLMMQKPIISTDATTELVTPTGAALVHGLCSRFEQGFSGKVLRMGTGYGSRPANAGLRIYLVEPNEQKHENIAQLESNIDHLTGEEIGACIEVLSQMPEVLDVLWLSGVGKKNRPTGLLRILCMPEHMDKVRAAFFTHTHSLGIRQSILERRILARNEAMLGELAAKEYILDGNTWIKPECDALIHKAKELSLGLPSMRMQKKH